MNCRFLLTITAVTKLPVKTCKFMYVVLIVISSQSKIAPKSDRRIYSNSSKKRPKSILIRCEKYETRLTMYINATKISSVRVPSLLSSNPCLSTSPGLAILLGVTDRLSLSIMAERADIGVERTLTQLLLRSGGHCEKLTEKRRRSLFPLVQSFI